MVCSLLVALVVLTAVKDSVAAQKYTGQSEGQCVRYTTDMSTAMTRTLTECAVMCLQTSSDCNGFVYTTGVSVELGTCHMYPYVEVTAGSDCVTDTLYIKHKTEILTALAEEQSQACTVSTIRENKSGISYEASRGVDGERDSSGFGGTYFASTELEKDPWYQVELKKPYNIQAVKVWSRDDAACCTTKLGKLEVRIAMQVEHISDENSLCTYDEAEYSKGEAREVPCEHLISGQYVRVQKLTDTEDYLELAELEIHGF